MSIKLYIGAHKTATTHIQSILDANRALLAENSIKLSIPQDIRKEWLSNFIAYCNSTDTQTPKLLLSEYPKHGAWLVTDENFSGTPYDFKILPGIYPNLKKRLSCFKQIFKNTKIELYFSVRSYDSFYISAYLEVVRNRGYIPFQDYYDEKRFNHNTWIDVIDAFATVFPEKNITLWRYEDFKELVPNILRKITGLADTDALIESYKVKITRPSISYKTIKILASKHPKITRQESKEMVEKLNKDYPANDENGYFLPFSKSSQKRLSSQYEQDIKIILNKYPNINFLLGDKIVSTHQDR